MDVTKVHIYKEPPDRETLRQFASKLEGGARALIGTRGRAYRDLGLKDKQLTDEEWLDWIEKEPRLLRRPILTDGQTVLVGFSKPEWEAAFGR